MKTPLLVLGALLTSSLACESHDCLIRVFICRASQSCASAQSDQAPPGNKRSPAGPAKPATPPARKARTERPALPAHLFM